MAKYRVSTLDLPTRIEIVAEMLLPPEKREWGRISQLAEKFGVSRTRLYQLKEKALGQLESLLTAECPGPKASAAPVVVDEAMIKRAISIFPLIKGSTRDIQMGLEMLFGVKRSVGYIHSTLKEAGERATAYNQQLSTTQPILAEVDEIFQGRRPCLTVVDGRSFFLLNLTPADARDETSWGVTLLDLAEQGYEFADVVADGARGIAAGLAATEWGLPLQPDLFHLLRDAHPISKRLEKQAYRAIEAADHARLVEWERQQPRRRQGKPRQPQQPLSEAQAEENAAIDTLDVWLWLLQEVRSCLAPITSSGQIRSVQTARDTLTIATRLMRQLARGDVNQFADKLDKYREALLAPLVQLEGRLAQGRTTLSPQQEQLIVYSWLYRQEFQTPWFERLPPALQATAQLFDQALSLFHRASSLAESIHAWVRPYLQIHRGLPTWLAPLLQLWWNHHRFQRGKRTGFTPAELVGIPHPPSLTDLFASLF